MYTIYKRPLDYPKEYVARRWIITRLVPVPEAELFARGKSLAEVRRALPPGLFNLGREAADDPKIVEVWI